MTRFDRIEHFQSSLKELHSADWLTPEAHEWLSILNDPELNRVVMASVDALLSRCRPVWNEEMQSFCQVPAVLDSVSNSLRKPKSRPKLRLGGRNINASRGIFVMGNCLPIGQETLIRHRCDNPYCLEVEHLVEGDYLDNEADKRK
jgi:hypothetical protein